MAVAVSFRSLILPVAAALSFSLPLAYAAPAHAAAVEQNEADSPTPHTREFLENIQPVQKIEIKEGEGLPMDIRFDAMKEAALSFGARGGLAWRTYEIRQEMETRSSYMDRVFDFRLLLIPAPSGLLIEPPVVSESVNAMIINTSGTEAAVADRFYEINRNAKIVSTSRHWRNYLERDWGAVTPPPDLLLPQNEKERYNWVEWIRIGWDQGAAQADDIFQDDLNQLTAHYQGMVRYRMLLSQGMITPPYALQVDRGVTGGGNAMRVGDRAVQITAMPELTAGSEKWQPASR